MCKQPCKQYGKDEQNNICNCLIFRVEHLLCKQGVKSSNLFISTLIFQTVASLRLSFFVYSYMMSPFLCLHSPLPPEDLKADWHHTRRMGRFDGQYSIATASSAVLRICAHIADKSGKRHKRIFGRADILGGKIQVCRSMEPPRHGR